jgi:transcriptional regulator with XRE-family HTH domain
MADNHHPLAKFRVAQNLTQEDLARQLKVAPHTVWRWENGKRLPRASDAKRISKLTGISVGELYQAGVDQ